MALSLKLSPRSTLKFKTQTKIPAQLLGGDGVTVTFVNGIYTVSVSAPLSGLLTLDSTPGIVTQTAANAFTKRTLTGTANEITVTNGNGASGVPTFSLPAALTLTGKTITGGTYVADKLSIASMVYDARRHGVVADGVTDDLAALNSCITAAAATGGIVQLPAGAILVGNSVNFPDSVAGVSRVWLRGAGEFATTIRAAPSFPVAQVVYILGTCKITDLTVDVNANASVVGINNATATGGNLPTVLRNVGIVNMTGAGGTGFYNTGTKATYLISDCRFIGAQGLVNANWGTGSVVSNNLFLCTGTSVLLTHAGASNEGIVLTGNSLLTSGAVPALIIENGVNLEIIGGVVDGPAPSVLITGSRGTSFGGGVWIGHGLTASNASQLNLVNAQVPNGGVCSFTTITGLNITGSHFYGGVAGQQISVTSCSGAIVGNTLLDAGGGISEATSPNLIISANKLSGTCVQGTARWFNNIGVADNYDLPFSSLTQGPALSVLGVTGNATADVASIAAGSDHQVLRRSGTALTFGAVNLASSNAVTGQLVAGSFPALTGDLTTAGGALATTLATVNSNVGTFGSATQSVQFTVNGKGLITAAANVTVTPAVGSITGLGTGVATALAANVGSAGAPVTFNGAGGTPSSLTLTNATGLPVATGISGLGANVATFLATPSSANLAAALTDESNSGVVPLETSGTWTPTLAYVTPGTSSFAYSVQAGWWTRTGRVVTAHFNVTAVPTNGTGAGNLLLTGLPVASANVSGQNAFGPLVWGGITKASYTSIAPRNVSNTTQLDFIASGSGVAASAVAVADVPSGGTLVLAGTIEYVI